MNWSRYKLSSKIFFAGLVWLILRHPYQQIIYHNTGLSITWQQELFFLFCLFSAGVWVELYVGCTSRTKEIISLLLLFGFQLSIILLAAWPPLIFTSLVILTNLISLRQSFYRSQADLSAELPRLLSLYLLVLLYANFRHINVNITEIIIFFILLLFFNHFAVADFVQEQTKGSKNWHMAIFFFISSLGLTLLLILIFNLPFHEQLSSLMAVLFQSWSSLMEYLAYVIGWLLYPLLFVLGQIVSYLREGFGEENVIWEGAEEYEPLEIQETVTRELQEPGFTGFIILLLLFILAIFIIKKIIKKREKESEDYREERERLAAAPLLRKQSQKILKNIKDKISSRFFRPNYDLQNPVEKVRYHYYRFLKFAGDYQPKPPGLTPRGYQTKMLQEEKWQEAAEQLQELTSIYEKARYSRRASAAEAEKASQLLQEIKNKVSDSQV